MSRQKIFIPLSLAVFLALLVAAVTPLAALAQDEAPPQPDAPVVVVEEPVAEEPAVEESAAEEIIVSEVLEQLPEDTGLVLLDEEGEVLPLASTEAAEVIAAPDPYFTVGGVTYRFFGTAGACGVTPNCWDGSATPIQDAIDYLSTILKASPDNGNVYVEAGTYSEDVYVSGADWLTDGGSVPLSLGIIGAGSGSTTLNGSFNVSNMNAFTLSGFTVIDDSGDAILMTDNTGELLLTDLNVTTTSEESTGIRVDNHTGNVDLVNVSATTMGTGVYIYVLDGDVTLNNVTSDGNPYGGANVYTDNGDVAVTGGSFSNNHDTGLNINANGNVTLDGVTAVGNNSYGLGIFIDSGNVNLNNVISTGNGSNGVYVSTADGSITVNGGDFSDNVDGLDIRTDAGNVTLNNVISKGNEAEGVYVWTPGAILINGGDFSNNGGWGLYLSSPGGTIKMDNVTAIGNLNGARLGASDIKVFCGNYSNNEEYGLVLGGGHTFLGGPIFTGNGLGEYDLVSGTVSFGSCEKLVGHDKSGEGGERGFKPQNNLSDEPLVCNGEKKVSLENGDAFGMYENLCDVDFQLQKETEPPGQLSTQLGILNVQLTSGGISQSKLPLNGRITLKFPIPRDADENGLVVLFWDGSAWVEVSGGRVIDGFYVIEATQPGIYALTSK